MPVNVLHTRGLLVAVVAAAAVVVVGPPTAATALDCVSHPDASPRAIAEGTEELAVEGAFRERYDGAIFGTVLSLETQDDGEEPHYGRTEAVVDVIGAFGPEVEGSAVIVEDDPGWLDGYAALEVGTHYFIPYAQNDKGRYSRLCDPIAEVDPADVPELVELAQQNAWGLDASNDNGPSEEAAGITDGQPPAEAAGESGSSSGSARTWLVALLGLLAAAVAASVWMRHKGRDSENVSVS